jgi:hypothetical protein
MRQNLGWAIGYNSLALPIAAGIFEPFGFTLRPEIGAISMSGSSVLVAVNALALKRLRLPRGSDGGGPRHQRGRGVSPLGALPIRPAELPRAHPDTAIRKSGEMQKMRGGGISSLSGSLLFCLLRTGRAADPLTANEGVLSPGYRKMCVVATHE